MIALGTIASPILRYGAAAAAGFFIAWTWQSHSRDAEDGREATQQAEKVVIQVQEVRAVERSSQAVVDDAAKRGHHEIETARAAAVDARAAADRMQYQLRNMATQLATCNAGTAAERQARAAAGDVLTTVLDRLADRSVRLAEYADKARAAGLACERAYDGVREAQAKR